MVKEDDEPEKKRWFSRTKKSSIPSNVSRPPFASPSPLSRTPRASEDSTVNDDLPPRTKVDTPEQAPEAANSTPNLPLRAGFDFDAIKSVLGKAELNSAELQMPQPNRFPPPHIPPPTQRSESTPRPVSPPYPPRSSLDSPYMDALTVTPGSHTDLTSAFSNSVSLEDTQPDEEPSSHPSALTPRPLPSLPDLSFAGSNGGTPWSADTSQGEILTASSATEPLARPFGYHVHGHFSTFSSPAISFGGTDGSITSDPWNTPAHLVSDKRRAGFNANPWT